MRSRDMSQNAKLRSDDMEPDPRLDSAHFLIESNKTTNKAGHYDRRSFI